MSFLTQNGPTVLLVLAMGVTIYLLMRRSQQRRAEISAREAAPPRRDFLVRGDAQQPLKDAPPELVRWQVEMHDLARDLKGELDTKIAVVQRLILDARQEAERLERLLDRPARSDRDDPGPQGTPKS